MCLSSVSSRKFFFRASWLVFISFNSFSSFSNEAWEDTESIGGSEGAVSQQNGTLYGESEANSHLQVNHVSWKRDLGVLSRVNNWDACLPYFFFHESCTGGKGGMHKNLDGQPWLSMLGALQNQKKTIKFTISVNVVAKNLNFTKFVCTSVRRSEESVEI